MRNTSFRGRKFTLEDIMCTTGNMCSDRLSRPSSTQSIAGREVAMHAQCDLNGIARPICKSQCNYPNDCPKYDLYVLPEE